MVVGITGSIASGKSLVTNYLKQKKYNIVDSDKISHSVLELEEVVEEIAFTFGNEYIIDSKVNRKKLGQLVFTDKEQKEKLQSIVFPHILKEINRQLSMYNGLVFLDAPLLIEYNLIYLVDKIIVVKIDKQKQIQRLMKRDNITEEYAIKKIESQLSNEEKEKYADYVIDNNYDIENTYKQIKEILKYLEE